MRRIVNGCAQWGDAKPGLSLRMLREEPGVKGSKYGCGANLPGTCGGAIFAATGQRLRETPFHRFVDFA